MPQLTDGDEVLLRQIHPHFFQDGVPASVCFAPTFNDDGKLSVDRSRLTTAKDAFELYQRNGGTSAAVFGVSVAEFSAEGIVCTADPLPEDETGRANPAHALADYGPFGAGQRKTIAKRLKIKASARGRLYP